jgi:hypothetical protein
VGAFVAGLAAQAALMSMVCAYAGTVAGFAAGVTQSLQATVQLGGCLVHKGAWLCSWQREDAGTRVAACLLVSCSIGRCGMQTRCCPHAGGILARTAGSGAVRGLAAAGQLAAPLLLGLLRTLALSRMFA